MVQKCNRYHFESANDDGVGLLTAFDPRRTPTTAKAIVNLHPLLQQREAEGRPIRVGLIGAGRFGTMYLSQARNIPGVHVVAIADINTARAQGAFELVGWPADQVADSIEDALARRATTIVSDAAALFDADIDVIVEATGNPIVGVDHALRAIETGKHIIMVTVEADALAGPALAARARAAGVVYSLYEAFFALTEGFTPAERRAMFSGTATRFYRIAASATRS